MAIGAKEVLKHVIPEIRDDIVWYEFLNALFENSQGELDAYALYNWIGTLPDSVKSVRNKYAAFAASDVPFLFKGGSLYNVESACAIQGQALKSSGAVLVELDIPKDYGTVKVHGGTTVFDTLMDFSLLPLDHSDYGISGTDPTLYLELGTTVVYITLGGGEDGGRFNYYYKVGNDIDYIPYTGPFAVAYDPANPPTIHLKAVAKEGYTFTGWHDGVATAERDITCPSAPTTYYADSSVNTYTFAVSASHGTVTGSPSSPVQFNTPITLVCTPDTHYLAGQSMWSGVPAGATYSADYKTVSFRMPAANTSIVVTCIPDYVMLTVSGTNCIINKSPAPEAETETGYKYFRGTAVILTCVPSDHYHFVKWSDNNTSNPRTVTLNQDFSVSTAAVIDTHSVTVAAEDNYTTVKILVGGVNKGTSTTVNYGTQVTVVASFATHYHFHSWTDGGAASHNITVNENKSLTAKSEIDKHTLTLTSVTNLDYFVYKKVSGSWEEQSAPYVFDYGSQLKVIERSNHDGYETDGWADGVTGFEREFILSGDTTLQGKLKARYFTVSCTTNYCTVAGTGSKAYGSVVSLVVSPSAHYKIESDPWTDKPAGATVSADFKTLTFNMPAANTTVICTAQPQVYNFSWSGVNQTIAVKVNGTTVTDNPHPCTYPSTVQVTSTPVPTGGYTFTKWSILSGSTIVGTSTANPFSFSIERATSVVGQVTAVNYNTVSGTLTRVSIDSGLGSHAYGSTVRIAASADSYYELYNGAWSLTCGSSSVAISSHADDWSWVEFVQPVGDVTVNVAARRYTYHFTMTVSAGNGNITGSYTYEGITYDLVSGQQYSVPAGIAISMTANPDSATHYVFNRWSDGETNRSRTVQVTAAETVYYASFKLEQYQVTFSKYATYDTTTVSATAGGVAISSGAYVDYGKTVIITCNPLPSDKYSFTSWKSGSTVVSTNATYTINSLSSAVNVVAYLGIKTYALTVSGVHCAVSGAGTYEYGTTVVVSATPNSHYHWGSWSDGGAQTHSVTITGATTLTATALLDTHVLTMAGVDCTVSPGSGTYDYGSVVEVSVPSIDAHHHWGQWSDGGARTHNITITGDMTLIATAAVDTHTLTLTGVGCTVTGAGTYNYGTSVNVSCTPYADYHFHSWTDGGAQTHAVYVNEDKSLTAACYKDMYVLDLSPVNCTITYGPTPGSEHEWGQDITIQARPYTNYHFEEGAWVIPSGVEVIEKYEEPDIVSLRFIMPKSDITIGCNALRDRASVTYWTYYDTLYGSGMAADLSFVGSNVVVTAIGSSWVTVEVDKNTALTVTAKNNYSYCGYLGWYDSDTGSTLITNNASMTTTIDGSDLRFMAKYSEYTVTFTSGDYKQVGNYKQFAFVISGSSSGLYGKSIDVAVTRRVDGETHWSIATETITLSNSGTYTQSYSASFQTLVQDTYTNAVYYITFEKDGHSLGYFYLGDSGYLRFTATVASTIGIKRVGTVDWSNVKYSFDNGTTWTYYTLGTSASMISVSAGQTICWKANKGSTAQTTSKYIQFVMTGSFEAHGNVTSLLSGTEAGVTDLSSYGNSTFYRLFYSCSSLVNPPSLPAQTLVQGCYRDMFSNCTSLVNPPALPATTLATYCYQNMFYNCSAITTAPALPATSLAQSCYQTMFYKCTSLVNVSALPATSLAPYCYAQMFSTCTSLVSSPVLSSTNLAGYCYQAMFQNCTSLTLAPSLPATTLVQACYNGMFQGCTSLVTAPKLIASELAGYCYQDMFKGCSHLGGSVYIAATSPYSSGITSACLRMFADSGTETGAGGYIYVGGNVSDWNSTNAGIDSTYWTVSQGQIAYVTFDEGSYTQSGTKKRFGFVISGSTSSLYSQSIDIEVHRRRTGVAEETIVTGSVTLSSSGTYTQLPGVLFQASDTYTDATYYIYAYKNGSFLGSVECEGLTAEE